MKSFDTVARCRIRPSIVDEIAYLFIVYHFRKKPNETTNTTKKKKNHLKTLKAVVSTT